MAAAPANVTKIVGKPARSAVVAAGVVVEVALQDLGSPRGPRQPGDAEDGDAA